MTLEFIISYSDPNLLYNPKEFKFPHPTKIIGKTILYLVSCLVGLETNFKIIISTAYCHLCEDESKQLRQYYDKKELKNFKGVYFFD